MFFIQLQKLHSFNPHRVVSCTHAYKATGFKSNQIRKVSKKGERRKKGRKKEKEKRKEGSRTEMEGRKWKENRKEGNGREWNGKLDA